MELWIWRFLQLRSTNPTFNSARRGLTSTALMAATLIRTLNNFVENDELRDARSHGPAA